MLETLIEIAEGYLETGETTPAANILALVIHYPLHPATRQHAEGLLTDLEMSICPRVIYDARERALNITLDDLVRELLAAQDQASPPDPLSTA